MIAISSIVAKMYGREGIRDRIGPAAAALELAVSGPLRENIVKSGNNPILRRWVPGQDTVVQRGRV